jgi:hypothetical protein
MPGRCTDQSPLRGIAMPSLEPTPLPLVLRRRRLGALVGGLLCCHAAAAGAEEILIPRGAGQWRYFDAPAAAAEQLPSDGWTAVDFDDSQWPEGQALLGYGDPDVRTELSFGGHPQRKESSALFRRRFGIARRGPFRLFRGRLCCDDGAVVFINGREVFRYNMPSGRVTYGTRAVRAIGPDPVAERTYHQFAVQPDTLVEGENVVAVSVHQANGTSSDLAMDLELTGLTSDAESAALEEELKRQAERDAQAGEASLQMGPVVQFDVSGD